MDEKEKKFEEWWTVFTSGNQDDLWSERQRMLAKISWSQGYNDGYEEATDWLYKNG